MNHEFFEGMQKSLKSSKYSSFDREECKFNFWTIWYFTSYYLFLSIFIIFQGLRTIQDYIDFINGISLKIKNNTSLSIYIKKVQNDFQKIFLSGNADC